MSKLPAVVSIVAEYSMLVLIVMAGAAEYFWVFTWAFVLAGHPAATAALLAAASSRNGVGLGARACAGRATAAGPFVVVVVPTMAKSWWWSLKRRTLLLLGPLPVTAKTRSRMMSAANPTTGRR